MIYWVWAVFKRMAPFKVVTLDDRWDQMNRSFMMPLTMSFAYLIDYGIIAGSTIKCTGFEDSFRSDAFVDEYCWTQGIYTMREAYDLENTAIPYPGIIPEGFPNCMPYERWDGMKVECPKDEQYLKPTRVYHLYYQHIQLYFWLVCTLFYLPYMVGICLGFNYTKPLITLLHDPLTRDEDELEALLDKAARSLRLRLDIYSDQKSWFDLLYRRHTMLYLLFFIKLQYLGFSVAILGLTQAKFKIGNFLTYGFEWVGSQVPNGSTYTLVQHKLFPKMAACEIKRWGASGLDVIRGMCVLPQNVSNSYIFLVFWIFLLLTILGNVIGSILTVKQYLVKSEGYSKLVACTFWNDWNLRHLYWNVGGSGRVILHHLADNLHPCTFEKLIRRYWWLKRNEYVQYNGHLKTS